MLTLNIDTGNAAFDDDDPHSEQSHDARNAEVARILRELAHSIESSPLERERWSLFDANGNRVGVAEFTNISGGRSR